MQKEISIDVFRELTHLLKPGQVIYNPVEMLTYEIDAALDRGHPDAVAFPGSLDDIKRILKWAAERSIPIVARGSGTGLSGGAVASQGGLVLEFSRMNHIVELDQEGRSVVVEPGVVNQTLDEYVKKFGLYYPPDPASGRACTLGGNIAENAGGPHCFKYGVTTNYLTGLEVVLAGGRVIQLGGRAIDYPEYDFTGLVAGSEGTLGAVTRAYIRLLRNPPAIKTMMAAFNSVEDAGQAVSGVIARGLVPTTMEMMDQKVMQIVENFAHAGLPVQASAALIIEVDGYPESLNPQMDEVARILQEFKGFDLRVAQSAAERDTIWYGRKSAIGAMARLAPSYLLQDGTVPRSRLAETLSAINRTCEKFGLGVGYVFHAGDGNLHPLILIEAPDDPTFMERVHLAGDEIMDICVNQGGSITGEHGIGIGKRKYLGMMFNDSEVQALKEIKKVFDPQGIMNPGKIFEDETAVSSPLREVTGQLPSKDLPSMDREVSAREESQGFTEAPSSTEEAARLIRDGISRGAGIRIRGGGTKSSLLPTAERTLLTKRLCGISAFAIDDLYVTVRAGTSLSELQDELGRKQMWVPLYSPWNESTIGGVVATNYNAPLRMRYGGIRDLVLSLTAVLPDGRILRLGRPVVKNVAGYDLAKLFIGSYGTLGLLTEITFKLAPLPRKRLSLVVPVDELKTGLEWGKHLLKTCLVASALILVGQPGISGKSPYQLIYTAEGTAEDVDT
ncbi:MAG: FAD-binding oxidoreductase, partial [Omnitrophica WOR_2 bacterium]